MKNLVYVIIGLIVIFGIFLLIPRANNSTSNSNEGGNVDNKAAATSATIKTSKGDIVVELYSDVAPKTVANFVSKAQSNFYADKTFHRVEDWVIQGGDPAGNGTGGGEMATEINSKPFITGSLGVARGNDIKISNDSQFFIVKSDSSWLNSQYTNFGLVTSGMDVVNKIAIGDKILSVTVQQ
jgi:peptidyl-prolyl cis-trans isomerase B (cyclophilin B)